MCLGTHAPQRRGDGAIEVGYIVRDEVRQVSILAVIPHQFCWVEIRRICGQPFNLKPVRVFCLQQPHGFAMGAQAVQHQDELAPQVPAQKGDELDHFLKVDVLTVNLKNRAPVGNEQGRR